MTAQEYILFSLQQLSQPAQQAPLSHESLEAAILARCMSKKFRKLKADDQAISDAKTVIHYAVSHHEPVTFDLLFGGNKLWRFAEAPEVDWAELFAVTYYLRYLKSIADIYEHGARLVLYSQNVSVERLNNVPFTETEQYTSTFKALLAWLKPYMPAGTEIVYRQHAEEFTDRSEYDAEIEAAKAALLEKSGGKLPVLTPAQKIATELNVRLRPHQTDDPQWREKVELEHQAIFTTPSLRKLFNEEGKSLISISPTPFPGVIATGSTKKSIAKFWAGVGALEHSGSDFNELVLTPKQLEQAQFDWETIELAGLKGKNFKKIRILHQRA